MASLAVLWNDQAGQFVPDCFFLGLAIHVFGLAIPVQNYAIGIHANEAFLGRFNDQAGVLQAKEEVQGDDELTAQLACCAQSAGPRLQGGCA